MVNLFLLLAIAASAENWPQWRGPDSAGTSSAANLPSEWSAAGNIAWKTAIPGNGHSSPLIWGDRIFLTTSIEGAPTEGAKAPAHRLNGQPFVHPSSVDAERIYALQVLAVDRRSGKILWTTTAFEGKVYDARHKKNTYATPTAILRA
ncbi:MAG TPA: PQQ-binding-like beta-propeller repeat protein [Bryobacteraceae bacterium]|nr:PQQ-binding-like beta-propeller repeat protein [Bryobacteraceae bacterium]